MNWFLALMLVYFYSCSQLTSRQTVDESKVSDVVKLKMSEARELMKLGKHEQAILRLGEISDENLQPLEKSLKYNLKGVILFNLNKVEVAIRNFEVAEKYAEKSTNLYSQIQLNIASGHFKLGQMNELKEHLSKINFKLLTEPEKKKYSQLSLAYARKMDNHHLIVSSSLRLLADAKTIPEVQSSNYYLPMLESFKKLTVGQKIDLLEEFDKSANLAVANLAMMEAEARYLNGDKSGAGDVVSWLKASFDQQPEVKKFIDEFDLRMENAGRISLTNIGLVLPLSGDKMSFGQKALSGIDAGLKFLGMNEAIKIHTKDAGDSPARGAQAVLDLIKEEKVAFLIGGLFPESAKQEYLEARKYGVLFISLSQINLPKEEKNHHLIEIQGSIESQVETLLSDEMIKKFGTRMGLIYPDSEGGKAYADEIWRKGNQKQIQITSLAAFPKNTHDYRDISQLFLGLKYPRERSEELNILENVYSLEKSSIRRVQTLPPVLDFDWVFLATYPHEAIGIIPTLGYYDANRIKVIGGPSWVANSMKKEQKNLGTLYFVGDDPKDLNQDLVAKFRELYQKPPGLIETYALDAIKLGSDILKSTTDISARDEFDSKLKAKELKGLSSSWNFQDGVWIKKMNAMAITRGEFVKLFGQDSM